MNRTVDTWRWNTNICSIIVSPPYQLSKPLPTHSNLGQGQTQIPQQEINLNWLDWIIIHLSHIDGLVQERRNSSGLAMELCLSCTNPSINTLELHLSCTNPSICVNMFLWISMLNIFQCVRYHIIRNYQYERQLEIISDIFWLSKSTWPDDKYMHQQSVLSLIKIMLCCLFRLQKNPIANFVFTGVTAGYHHDGKVLPVTAKFALSWKLSSFRVIKVQ